MKYMLVMLLLTLMCACANSPQPTPAAQAARQLEIAISNGDRAALERLLAEDFHWIRGSGETGDKQAFITALTDERLDIAPFTAQQVRWIKDGALALQSGINVLEGTGNGEAFVDRHHFSDLWRWRDGRWQLVLAQVTRAGNNE